jgi:L-iditol 2-dehydrogenase
LKAVVKRARGDGFVELAEVPEPELREGTVILRVEAAGICGTDVQIYHDRFQGYNVPVTMGHEFSGTIESVGKDVPDLNPGDRVVSETHAVICGECEYCRTGVYNLCQTRKGFGYGVDGAFAKLVRVRKGIIHRLPEEIPLKEAALIEPLSVAVNAMTRNSRVLPGESVLVIGPGPIGLFCLQGARVSGGRVTVVGTERGQGRLELAMRLGAAETLFDRDLRKGIEDGALRNTFDVTVVATGNAESFELGLRATRPGGRVVYVGETTEKSSFPLNLIERKNITVSGSFSHNWPVWEDSISLARHGAVDLSSLISHEFGLADWESAFETAETRKGNKVLLRP